MSEPMHNLQLTEDQTLILDTVRKFVQDSVAPSAQERDESRQFAREEFAGLAELGLFGLPVAEEQGGAGMGLLPLAFACEEIGAHSGSLGQLLTSQVACAVALAAAADAGPLAEVASGEKVAALVGVENAVAFAAGKLTGSAELVPAAAEADVLVVVGRDGGKVVLTIVEPAAVTRTPLRSLGLSSAAPARIDLAGADGTVLADGEAAARAVAAADLVRVIGGAATCIGMGRASMELAHRHAGERIAFGKPLLAQQAVVNKLVESRRAVDAARHLVYHAARLADLGEDASAAAFGARIAAVDAAVLAADEGIQIHGGYGYTVEYHVERHYRDAKTIEVLDGGPAGCLRKLATAWFQR